MWSAADPAEHDLSMPQVPNGIFTCAASFGNVHGVYAPGNVDLQPVILHNSQKFISEKLGGSDKKPMFFVFHGGSGSSTEDIKSVTAFTFSRCIPVPTRLLSHARCLT